jgi:histidyl-tRNA synthetase
MTKLETAPYKGVRDFYPEDKFIQNYIFNTWRKVAELFGYEEYDASVLEPAEIYREKSGDQIVNEQSFLFTDRGGREVMLRPEMTPTLARMVTARRRELGFPLRLYSIPNLFRYEATQRGRLREHWQLNMDIFGISNMSAEIELVTLADKMLKSFGAKSEDYEIRLNTHGDKKELDEFMEILRSSGIENIRYDETLARGQAYYTGIVFEFFDTNPQNNRSILGGGRYDNLTALFGDTDLPAAGFGWGDVTMKDFLETHNLLPTYKPATQAAVLLPDLGMLKEAVEFVVKLRMQGVNVAFDFSGNKLGDQIRNADKNKIPNILVFGEEEVKSGQYKVKNLKSGEEKSVSLEEIAECVK